MCAGKEMGKKGHGRQGWGSLAWTEKSVSHRAADVGWDRPGALFNEHFLEENESVSLPRGQKIEQNPSWDIKQVLMCRKRQQQWIHTSERAGGSYKLPGKGSDLKVSGEMQEMNAYCGSSLAYREKSPCLSQHFRAGKEETRSLMAQELFWWGTPYSKLLSQVPVSSCIEL